MKAHSRKGKKQAARRAKLCRDLQRYFNTRYHNAHLYFDVLDNCSIFKRTDVCPYFCNAVESCCQVSEGHWTILLMHYPNLFDEESDGNAQD